VKLRKIEKNKERKKERKKERETEGKEIPQILFSFVCIIYKDMNFPTSELFFFLQEKCLGGNTEYDTYKVLLH